MSALAEKIKKKHKTPYQRIAEKYKVHYNYVARIALGKQTPKRGKGLLIKQELERIANQ